MSVLVPVQQARAHPAAAEPPIFGDEPCITLADARSMDELSIQYTVPFDDTLFEDGDIRLPDAKTHQFFALRGALVMGAMGYELMPFDPALEARIVMPLWIHAGDVERAEAAVEGSGTMFTAGEVPSDALLDMHPDLAGLVERIDPDDARRPITVEAAYRGLNIQLAALHPGAYTIAAYIFSPPYNGWFPKPGIVSVIDAEQHGAAASIRSIAGVLRAFEGRTVRACLAAPEGTTLAGSFFVVERPDLGWRTWLAEESVPENEAVLERCFHNPDAAVTGSVRVRLELRSPDGTAFAAYSPDTLTVLNGSGVCTPSETVCCNTPAPEPPEPTEPTPDHAQKPAASCAAIPSATTSPLAPYPSVFLLAAVLRARVKGRAAHSHHG